VREFGAPFGHGESALPDGFGAAADPADDECRRDLADAVQHDLVENRMRPVRRRLGGLSGITHGCSKRSIHKSGWRPGAQEANRATRPSLLLPALIGVVVCADNLAGGMV
jgi:hypothetical protein